MTEHHHGHEHGAHTQHMQMHDDGHQPHEHSMHMGHMGNLKQKFIISCLLGIPIIILSPMMGLSLPFQFTFEGSDYLVLILATVLFFYGGMPFLQGAKMELQQKSPAMMTLISLGISVSYVYSLYAFVNNHFFHASAHVMDFFWELATLILIMLLGHWIEMNAVSNAGDALKKMAQLLPGEATVVDEEGRTKEVPLTDVQIGTKLLVKAGGKMPADGVIVSGQTNVNEAMITGEAKDVFKSVNDSVFGGSVNGSGTITIKVTGTGESGYLSQVMALVKQAQSEKSRIESLSDRVAKWLFYVALFVGLLAFAVWLAVSGDVSVALERLVTVLVIACPHALGLAIPLVVARSTSLGAKNGLLIKKRQVLEVAKTVDVVMMDKTGTLTEGNFSVNEVTSLASEWTDHGVLAWLAALEKNSNHPLAKGIVQAAEKLELAIPQAADVQNIAGVGLVGMVDGATVRVTSAGYLDEHQLPYDKALFTELSRRGNTVSFLTRDDQVLGLVAQGDQIKYEAKDMIAVLKNQGIQPVMLTGDNDQVAHLVAEKLGISQVHSRLLPEDKETIIKNYQTDGHVVMMVGDGVNDAPSLARADVGVAIGAGTDVAVDSADVVLVKSDPADIIHLLSLAKNTSRKMIQNLWWGAGYNIIAIPLAAGVLAKAGLILSPAVGAVLMSLSTVIVAVNAMMLRIN